MRDLSNQITLDVLINGKSLQKYIHNSDTWIEGREGSEYSLSIQNHSNQKIVAVVSVDGLCVIDGETASTDSPGFIVEKFSNIEVKGWQVSNTAVKSFEFSSPRKAYAAKRGNISAQHLGVIGLIAFSTYNPKTSTPIYRSVNNQIYGSGTTGDPQYGLPLSTSNIGTMWGTDKQQFIHQDNSVKKDKLITKVPIVIYYDDMKGLEQRGIIVPYSVYKPDPFPGSNNFCK